MVLVSTMINMLIHHPDFENYDLSSLRTCVYGGSPMPEALIQFAMSRMPTWRFYQIFGMTETGGFATMLRWRDHLTSGSKARRLRSAGQPAPGNEVRVVLPDGSYAPPNTLGEIVVRSDLLMSGYLNNPEATAAVLRDGWMHTGDAGTIDEDGYLYVADRVKDMIVTGGENVYSIEVERVLFLHPGGPGGRCDRRTERAMGRGGACSDRTQGRRARHRGGAHRSLPQAHRRLQGPAQLRIPLGAAARDVSRQGAQERSARPLVERARTKDLGNLHERDGWALAETPARAHYTNSPLVYDLLASRSAPERGQIWRQI